MNGTNYKVPHCGAFSTPHSHPSWAQIFASGSCFQIPLACIQKNNHAEINKLVELQITRAAISINTIHDIISGVNDPLIKIPLTVDSQLVDNQTSTDDI